MRQKKSPAERAGRVPGSHLGNHYKQRSASPGSLAGGFVVILIVILVVKRHDVEA